MFKSNLRVANNKKYLSIALKYFVLKINYSEE